MMNINKNKRIILFFSILLILAVMSIGILNNEFNRTINKPENKKIIVATTYPIYLFTSMIAYNQYEVIQLLPAHAEPHTYEPTPKDVMTLETASAIIYNGAGLEPWINIIIPSLTKNKTITDTSIGIDVIYYKHVHDTDNYEKISTNTRSIQTELETDPHFWLDPLTAKIQLENIKKTMKTIDNKNSEYYDNKYAYINELLEKAHAEIINKLKNCKKREFLITHPTLAYFCRTYNCTQIPIAQHTHETEPSAQEFKRIIQFSKENNISLIVVEQGINQNFANAIATELNAEIVEIDTLHSNNNNNNNNLSPELIYVYTILNNTEKLSRGMGCE